jgi:hypothetical protein
MIENVHTLEVAKTLSSWLGEGGYTQDKSSASQYASSSLMSESDEVNGRVMSNTPSNASHDLRGQQRLNQRTRPQMEHAVEPTRRKRQSFAAIHGGGVTVSSDSLSPHLYGPVKSPAQMDANQNTGSKATGAVKTTRGRAAKSQKMAQESSNINTQGGSCHQDNYCINQKSPSPVESASNWTMHTATPSLQTFARQSTPSDLNQSQQNLVQYNSSLQSSIPYSNSMTADGDSINLKDSRSTINAPHVHPMMQQHYITQHPLNPHITPPRQQHPHSLSTPMRGINSNRYNPLETPKNIPKRRFYNKHYINSDHLIAPSLSNPSIPLVGNPQLHPLDSMNPDNIDRLFDEVLDHHRSFEAAIWTPGIGEERVDPASFTMTHASSSLFGQPSLWRSRCGSALNVGGGEGFALKRGDSTPSVGDLEMALVASPSPANSGKLDGIHFTGEERAGSKCDEEDMEHIKDLQVARQTFWGNLETYEIECDLRMDLARAAEVEF